VSREWRHYLADMVNACEKILTYTAGMTRDACLADSRT